ncbi:Uncharacterized protein EbC_24810 [Erwinia billingiae Eb661]|uniref:Uncharacterized protein n=1 Tax=Erwinia billingiae (strain Eb661) TaxID=634500 RepID=D8MT55_ERWBE|nr:Uncharacterized protein EbC_24810 [Erwinia billingiae Eb661]
MRLSNRLALNNSFSPLQSHQANTFDVIAGCFLLNGWRINC